MATTTTTTTMIITSNVPTTWRPSHLIVTIYINKGNNNDGPVVRHQHEPRRAREGIKDDTRLGIRYTSLNPRGVMGALIGSRAPWLWLDQSPKVRARKCSWPNLTTLLWSVAGQLNSYMLRVQDTSEEVSGRAVSRDSRVLHSLFDWTSIELSLGSIIGLSIENDSIVSTHNRGMWNGSTIRQNPAYVDALSNPFMQ